MVRAGTSTSRSPVLAPRSSGLGAPIGCCKSLTGCYLDDAENDGCNTRLDPAPAGARHLSGAGEANPALPHDPLRPRPELPRRAVAQGPPGPELVVQALQPYPLGEAEAPSADRLHRPVPAGPRRQGAARRRLAARAQARRLPDHRLHKDGERVRLWSRNGRDWSSEFVAITSAMGALPSAASCSTCRTFAAVNVPDRGARQCD